MVRILDLTAIQQADIDSNDHLVISNIGGSPMASSRVRVEDFVQYTLAGGSLGFATKSEVDSAIDANNTLHFPFTINAGLGLDSLSNGILDSANDTITINHTASSATSITSAGTSNIIRNITLDGAGHILSIDESNGGTIFLESAGVFAGTGLSGGGQITPGSGPVYISHPTAGGLSNSTNTGTNVLQSITFDTYGHGASVTPVDLTTVIDSSYINLRASFYTDSDVEALVDSAYVSARIPDFVSATSGDSMVGDYYITGELFVSGNITGFANFSDITLKENLEIINDPVDKVMNLNGYTFNYIGSDIRMPGLVAQEVEEVLPEAVYETPQGKKALHYANMVGLLVEAVKELKAEVEELKTKIG
jgi:hypothetical protein